MKNVFLSWLLLLAPFAAANSAFNVNFIESELAAIALQDQLDNPQGYKRTTSILRRINLSINGDVAEKRVQQIWYYPDTTAVEEYGTEQIYFDDTSEIATLHTAASVNPDTTLNSIDAATIQFGENDTYNTFNDAKVAYLPVPGLTAQSYTLLDYTIETDYRKVETELSEALWITTSFDYKRFEANVTWQGKDVQWHNSYPGLTCSETSNSLACQAENIKPMDIDNSTPWRDKIQGLEITAGGSWENVVERMTNAYEQAFTEQKKVGNLFEELTKNLETKDEKINAIHRYVSEQVRYVSLSTEGHSHTPHSNDSVIENRFGDCKDKTALLDALLERMGIDAKPRLVATNRTDPERLTLPSLGYFNHIILCFTEQGKDYCLDPTDTNTHWQSISDWIQGKVSLVLEHGAQPEIIPPAQYRWKMNIFTDLTFTELGGLEETQTRTYLGEYASYMRYQLKGEEDEKQRELLKEQYQDVVANIDAIEANLNKDSSEDYETLVVTSTAFFEPFAPTDQHLDYSEPDSWVSDEIRSVTLENEFDDYVYEGTQFKSEYRIDISAHWQALKPSPTLKLEHEFGSLTRTSEVKDGLLHIKTTLSIPHQTISLEKQEDFNTFMAVLADLQTVRIEAPLSE